MNLSRIYDIRDNSSYGQVLINHWYVNSVIGGNPGPLQTLPYPVPGVTMTASGALAGSTTWSGKVLVVGDVIVQGSLTIQPGTEIVFDPLHDATAGGADKNRCELIVDGGVLNVAGTAGSPVLFTSAAVNKDRGDWSGIRVVNGDVTLRYFTVEYATVGLQLEDSTTRFQTYLVEHGTLRYCSTGFRQTTGGDAIDPLRLSDLHLLRNGTGMDITGSLTLDHCESSSNDSTGINGSTGGTLTLTSCSVTNNGGYGLNTFRKNVVLLDSEFKRNSSWGVYCYGDNNGYGRLEMRNCTVRENSSGVQLYYYLTEVIMVGNTISDHVGSGLEWQVHSGQLGVGGITGNTIRSNQIGIRVSGSQPSVLALSGNDIYANRDFEIQNQGSIAVTATNGYWGEPTSTELNQNQLNLSRIYDQRDNGSYGLVTVSNYRVSPMIPDGGGATAPTITQHPQPQTVVAGNPASFLVAAAGTTPFRYQWRKNNNPISGATNASLVLLNVQTGDAGGYSVIVSNSAGTATSSSATLTVTPAQANYAVRTITGGGNTFPVSLAVSTPVGSSVNFVEETLPVGFNATGVNGGGSFNSTSRKILWGPLVGNQTHQLSYTLQPPGGFQGSASVSGTAYFGGGTVAVTGDSAVSIIPSGTPATLGLSKMFGFWTVSISGDIGRSYRLEVRDNLNSGSWQPLATLNITQNPRLYFDGDAVGKPQRFYRAVLVE